MQFQQRQQKQPDMSKELFVILYGVALVGLLIGTGLAFYFHHKQLMKDLYDEEDDFD